MAMRDITDLMNTYRESVRGLWNATFRPLHRPEDLVATTSDTALDLFEKHIEPSLFTLLVLKPIGKSGYRQMRTNDPIPFLRVVPNAPLCAPQVNRETREGFATRYEVVPRASSEGVVFRFAGYFDWDAYGYKDLYYYLVQIDSFPEHPEFVGRKALLETFGAGVFFDDDATA